MLRPLLHAQLVALSLDERAKFLQHRPIISKCLHLAIALVMNPKATHKFTVDVMHELATNNTEIVLDEGGAQLGIYQSGGLLVIFAEQKLNFKPWNCPLNTNANKCRAG
jgi:hypothetical protein